MRELTLDSRNAISLTNAFILPVAQEPQTLNAPIVLTESVKLIINRQGVVVDRDIEIRGKITQTLRSRANEEHGACMW